MSANSVASVGVNCCGCRGCDGVCPVNAISFQENAEGFICPVVSDSCVGCGKCLKICPIYEPPVKKEPVSGFAAYITDRELLRKSSSGGIFVAAAQFVLEQGGVVFGCAETMPGEPTHIAVTSAKELMLLQGSKYAQSKMDGVYALVDSFLKQGSTVMFSGTPCQSAGLRKRIGDHPLLITVDIICHGVPSRKMYRSYLQWLEGKTNAKVRRFSFRSKEKHDWSLTYRVELERNRKVRVQEKIASLSPYYSHFLKGMDYRESCYSCPFACKERVSDLTIGDFWGIDEVAPDFYNADGVSAVLINSSKGQVIWEQLQSRLTAQEVPVDQIVSRNGQLRAPTERPASRDSIYEILSSCGYDGVVKAHSNKKELLVDGIKNMLPNSLRRKVKRMIRGR